MQPGQREQMHNWHHDQEHSNLSPSIILLLIPLADTLGTGKELGAIEM